MRNAVPLNLKSAADILYDMNGDLASNRGRVIRLYQVDLIYALTCSIRLHSAAYIMEAASDVIPGVEVGPYHHHHHHHLS